MSAYNNSRKRAMPINVIDDSDDEIQVVLEVKKPRISPKKAKEKKNNHVWSFFEPSIRLKRIFSAILSTFGYSNNPESSEDSNDDSIEVDEVKENNHFPPPFSMDYRDDERIQAFKSSLRRSPKSSTVLQTNYEHDKSKNTFVTLPPSRICTKSIMSDPIHVPLNFQSSEELRSEHVTPECTTHITRTSGNQQPIKSSKSPKIHQPPVFTNQTVANSRCNEHSSSKMQSLFFEDDQVLLNETESKDDCSVLKSYSSQCNRKATNSFSQQNGMVDKELTRSKSFGCVKLSYGNSRYNGEFYSSKRNVYQSKPKSSKCHFTADEILRIQEIETYRELVKSYCSGQPSDFKKSTSCKDASVQVNLDHLNLVNGNYSYLESLNIRQPELHSEDESTNIFSKIHLKSGTSSYAFNTASKSNSLGKKHHSFSSRVKVSQSSPVPLTSFNTTKEGKSLPIFNDCFSRQFRNSVSPISSSNSESNSPEIIYEGAVGKNESKFDSVTNPWLIQPSVSAQSPEIICENDISDDPFIFKTNGSDYSKYAKNKSQPLSKQAAEDNSTPSTSNSVLDLSDDNLNADNFNSSPVSKFFSKTWIQELKKTVQEDCERTKKQVADQERQLKEYKESQANKYNKFKEILQRPEKKPAEVICLDHDDFFVLTPEMELIIDEALAPHSEDEVMATGNNSTVLWKDINTLAGNNWLNDEIINTYMFLLQERSKSANYPSVYVFTSFFYPKLKSQGYASVKRWTRKVDIFQYDLLLVPIHLGCHWCLAVVDFRFKKIQYYDSMGTHEKCLEILQDYLIAEHFDKKSQSFNMSGWELEVMRDIPIQFNSSDCGIFTLKYAEYIARNAKINFSQQNMQYFRRKTIYEIIVGQLM